MNLIYSKHHFGVSEIHLDPRKTLMNWFLIPALLERCHLSSKGFTWTNIFG